MCPSALQATDLIALRWPLNDVSWLFAVPPVTRRIDPRNARADDNGLRIVLLLLLRRCFWHADGLRRGIPIGFSNGNPGKHAGVSRVLSLSEECRVCCPWFKDAWSTFRFPARTR
ncbi:MAG: hypothetical protein BWY06_03334 [Candidatus Latescibacteria bacterium ADurb.Bin168]|nr:MAG: hypothetical protein BWY06_03334 [Candidatus Latescibacteria bacterium ADurb.Bin168]